MQTNTISAGYNTAYSLGAGSKEVKNGEGFADALQGISKKTPTITSSEGLTLRYRKDYVADDGSKCLTSWVDARTGVNTCVFKPADFDENDPVYRVEVWDKNGNMTEKMVRIDDVDPKHASSAEMYAYSVHLEETGACKDAVFSMMGAKNRFVDNGMDTDGLTALDWTKIMNDLMREQYTVGNREGYLRYKAFLDAMTGTTEAGLPGTMAGAARLPVFANITSPYAEEADDESMELSEAIRHFEEMHKITAEELKETDDWRNMSKNQWDKLLEGVDDFIDAQIERLREMKEVQEEAARKAAMMAPPDMRTVAASQAALDVAASGFMGATEPDAGTEHEKNWTKNLVTDDQVVLRTAKAAQEMETMAQARIAELAGGEASASSYADQPVWKWRDGKFGFSAEVFKNTDTDAEYTLRLRYDDGREETRVIDANEIDSSNCNIIDLHLKMYHLNDEGKIDQRSLMMNLTTAHLYMNYRIPDATVNTAADFISWYEQQLALERKYSPNSNNRSQLEQLLMYLSAS